MRTCRTTRLLIHFFYCLLLTSEINVRGMEETTIANRVTVSATPAVSIQNAYKRYSSTNVVLNGLNLTVPDNSMYEIRAGYVYSISLP